MKQAMPSQVMGDRVYDQLEQRLWDEPNKVSDVIATQCFVFCFAELFD